MEQNTPTSNEIGELGRRATYMGVMMLVGVGITFTALLTYRQVMGLFGLAVAIVSLAIWLRTHTTVLRLTSELLVDMGDSVQEARYLVQGKEGIFANLLHSLVRNLAILEVALDATLEDATARQVFFRRSKAAAGRYSEANTLFEKFDTPAGSEHAREFVEQLQRRVDEQLRELQRLHDQNQP